MAKTSELPWEILEHKFVLEQFHVVFRWIGDSCGFDNFPSLGITLFKSTFYFDSSPTYVGCGLICLLYARPPA
ncbi:hypothetical protein MLD38_002332 [Melastoma candidum]|uniref:Uncharacterized protein n=1 Tax=Melastoma candidum TaxID=119954 RepID=A0ACB9RZ84_9MYRT|nr:hypothetical protein MLD38_002332 [Melastoma candidum]